MSKSLKRVLSLTLSLVMMAAAFCMPAYAAEEDVHDGHDCTEHGVALDSGLYFAELSVAAADVSVAAAACCSNPRDAIVDSWIARTSYTYHMFNGNPCTFVTTQTGYQHLCSNCNYAYVEYVYSESGHTH